LNANSSLDAHSSSANIGLQLAAGPTAATAEAATPTAATTVLSHQQQQHWQQ
jgi:hypothetical protein